MAASLHSLLLVFSMSIFSSHILHLAMATSTITSNQTLKYPQTLISPNGTFALGFFTPQNSTNLFLGIWYNQVPIRDYVWVSNRNNPVNDSSASLMISMDGNLQIVNRRNQTLWTTGLSNATTPTTAQLQDSGNFVLLTADSNIILWQSSEHPTDTILPNLKMVVTGDVAAKKALRSWKSPSDPANGRFTCGSDSIILPQLVIWDGDRKRWRSGPWNGNIFIGIQFDFVDFINAGLVVSSDKRRTLTVIYAYPNQNLLSNYRLSYDGIFTQPLWDAQKRRWEISWHAPSTPCDFYGACGEFGICDARGSPICGCLRGFEPKNKEEWKKENWTGGCVRRRELQCQGDGFLKMTTMKVPDYANWVLGLDKDQCESQCLKNCSCLAYAYDSGAGCMTWGHSLIDIQKFRTSGVDLYIRLAHSELGGRNKKKIVLIVALTVAGALAVTILLFLMCWIVRRQGKRDGMKNDRPVTKTDAKAKDLPLFNFKDLSIATNNFDESNKLGQGGYGPVYQGKLTDGRLIAVKRLSETSGQGIEEFTNEVRAISELQHRNLVRLLGFCTEGEDKMLVYEYMPNKSLDAFIFDPIKKESLSWPMRFNVIEGICRGLLYLHRDSRLKIIHRDLKASNILLDEDLNPKISDFGMARIFGGNQDQDNTRRVVGTYGYMSPEYAMEGRISEKSDIYSFGVLLFEIITGMKNSSFWRDEEALSLLGYAWKLWNEGNIASIIDPTIADPGLEAEMVRCLHVGLLCVQEFATDRPTTPTVMAMLSGEIVDLPKPNQPGYLTRQTFSDTASSQQQTSANYVTFSEVSGR